MDTSKVAKGRAAVLLVTLKLLEQGIQVFEPIIEDTPIDLVVYVGSAFSRLQVKRAQPLKCSVGGSYEIPFRKITASSGKAYKIYKYDSTQVDYIVGVVVETGDIYCFPIEAVDRIKATIRVNPKGLSKWAPRSNRVLNPADYLNKIELGGTVFHLKAG